MCVYLGEAQEHDIIMQLCQRVKHTLHSSVCSTILTRGERERDSVRVKGWCAW